VWESALSVWTVKRKDFRISLNDITCFFAVTFCDFCVLFALENAKWKKSKFM